VIRNRLCLCDGVTGNNRRLPGTSGNRSWMSRLGQRLNLLEGRSDRAAGRRQSSNASTMGANYQFANSALSH
jgi:hypothetical protein